MAAERRRPARSGRHSASCHSRSRRCCAVCRRMTTRWSCCREARTSGWPSPSLRWRRRILPGPANTSGSGTVSGAGWHPCAGGPRWAGGDLVPGVRGAAAAGCSHPTTRARDERRPLRSAGSPLVGEYRLHLSDDPALPVGSGRGYLVTCHRRAPRRARHAGAGVGVGAALVRRPAAARLATP